MYIYAIKPIYNFKPNIVKETHKTFDSRNEQIILSTEKKYFYDSTFLQLRKVVEITSNKDSLITYYKYPFDFNNPISNEMLNRNMLQNIVESYQTKTNTELTRKQITYNKINNFIKPTIYKTSFNGLTPELDFEITHYDTSGNILSTKSKDNIYINYKYGYNNYLPIAKIDNTKLNEFFIENFEENSLASNTNAHTGFKCFTNNYAIPFIMPNNRNYIVQYFKFENGNWTLYTEPYTNNKTLTGTIDDVRVFPEDALMTSYTYIPLVGISAEINTVGLTTYYEYDGLGRLTTIKDNNNHIIKYFNYNYKQAYSNAEKVVTLYRNNNTCGVGGIGNAYPYKVEAGKYKSMVSQADANGAAQNDITINGQLQANTNGTCIYQNNLKTMTFQKKTCPTNYIGSFVTDSIQAKTAAYNSTKSVANADSLAILALKNAGQSSADNKGTCNCSGLVDRKIIGGACVLANKYYLSCNNVSPNYYRISYIYIYNDGTCSNVIQDWSPTNVSPINTVFYNKIKTQSFTKNTCGAGYAGSVVTYTLPLFASIKSQPAADLLATNDINANGQNYANTIGRCSLLYRSEAKTIYKTRSNNSCGTNGTGGIYPYKILEGNKTSTISLIDANNLALNDITNNKNAQTEADKNGPCTYISQPQPITKTRSCSEGGVGTTYTYTVPEGNKTSNNSLQEANNLAFYDVTNNKTAQDLANTDPNGFCIYKNSISLSGNFTKQCPIDCIKSVLTVPYSIAVNQFSSTLSLQEANTIATNTYNQQGQALANSTINCIPCTGLSRKIINNTCVIGTQVLKSCKPYKFGGYIRIYVYRFNDGSESAEFSVIDNQPCNGSGGGRKPLEK